MLHVDILEVKEYQPPYFGCPALRVFLHDPRYSKQAGAVFEVYGGRKSGVPRTTWNTLDTKFSTLVKFWRRECTT